MTSTASPAPHALAPAYRAGANVHTYIPTASKRVTASTPKPSNRSSTPARNCSSPSIALLRHRPHHACPELNVDVIVSDHHEFGPRSPAYAIVHPKAPWKGHPADVPRKIPALSKCRPLRRGRRVQTRLGHRPKTLQRAARHRTYRNLLLEFSALVGWAQSPMSSRSPVKTASSSTMASGNSPAPNSRTPRLIHAAGYATAKKSLIAWPSALHSAAPQCRRRMGHARKPSNS